MSCQHDPGAYYTHNKLTECHSAKSSHPVSVQQKYCNVCTHPSTQLSTQLWITSWNAPYKV